MKNSLNWMFLVPAVAVLTACSKTAVPTTPVSSTPAAAAHSESIAWQEGDVDAAFALAKAQNKPLFLYWGAVWCPPCNQVKATIFTRPDFIERSRSFVPVHLDGDTPAAQKLGARFNVSGYPTMILFKPDGTEITRLPGEIDAQRYLQVLALGLNATRGVKETLTAALAGDKPLTAEEWRLLAYYSWDTDDQEVIAQKDVASTLQRLADACPGDQADTKLRLGLKAITAAATADPDPKIKPVEPSVALRKLVMTALADPKSARENLDIFTNYPAEIAGYITAPHTPERADLIVSMDKDFDSFASDASVSTADQVGAVAAKVALAKMDAPKAQIPDTLLAEVRDSVKRADHDAVSPYERQSAIYAAGEMLAEAGLLNESDALYKAELTRSHQPYYFMLHLAGNAKARGDKAAALDWYEKAYAAAEGPATRLQWGVTYVNALIDLSPGDDVRISKAAQAVLAEVNETPETFYGRNLRSLRKMGKKFVEWDAQAKHKETFAVVQDKLTAICGRLPAQAPEKTSCDSIFVGAETGLT